MLRSEVEVVETLRDISGAISFGPPKTRASRRTVPVTRFVAEALGAHPAGVEPRGLVFPAPGGGPARISLFRRRIWAPAIEAAGIAPFRIHDLRHTAGALWIAAGASPVEIALRAGHTSVVTVLNVYGHLLPGAEERTTAALDAMADAVAASAEILAASSRPTASGSSAGATVLRL